MKTLAFLLFIGVIYVGAQVKEQRVIDSDIVKTSVCKKNLETFIKIANSVSEVAAKSKIFSSDLSWNNRACVLSGYKEYKNKPVFSNEQGGK